MKKWLLLVLLCVPAVLFAADNPEIPAWVGMIIEYLKTIPKVGPILVTVIKFIAIGAGLATSLVIFVRSTVASLVLLLKGSSMLLVWAKAPLLAGKIEALMLKINPIIDKIIYYLEFFSVFNAKKK